MNALVLAAGLGTRLRPLTDTMPKALVPINGEPLLYHQLRRLYSFGFDNIVVNAHHFSEQIIAAVSNTSVIVSHEPTLLDTGGALRQAMPLFRNDDDILIHNVDILSNVNLRKCYQFCGADPVRLVVSMRPTSRYLLFDDTLCLVGWINTTTGEIRTPYPSLDPTQGYMYAFSGIHIVKQSIYPLLLQEPETFPIIDFYLRHCRELTIRAVVCNNSEILDIGKHNTLSQAETFLSRIKQ